MSLITTIGEILVEIIATERGEGFREPQPLVGPFPSGAPAIFIDQVGKLGHPSAIVSAVGDDDFGQINLDRLKADGVDVSAVSVHRDIATGSAFVRYRRDGSRDFVYNIRHSANSRIGPSPAAAAVLARTAHLHVMGTSLSIPSVVGWIGEAIGGVKARGGSVSFDPNVRKEMLRNPQIGEALRTVLANADLFLPSGDELLMFAEASGEAKAVDRILAVGVEAVVLKRGAAGASYFDKSGETRVASVPVDEVDPTGAGDVFGATFIVCRRNGMPVAEALGYANAAGARNVTLTGPMEGTSTFAELDAFRAERAGV
ncbi:MAG: sugar kinase [Rhizobiales bacterium]|nr:sugar kinase [Hyphomicrobiales bacterium]